MRPAMCFLPLCGAAALLATALAWPAAAVVIATGSDERNLAAPGNDPGWNNVGRVASASGVYLGNRWVITANHVSNAPLRLSDGRELAVTVGSPLRLRNPDGIFGRPDLRMFQVAEDPGLPGLDVAAAMPAINSQIVMIGAGTDRAAASTGWQTFGPVWTEVSPRSADVLGYELLSTATMRWGVNLVSSGPSFGDNQTFSFATRFDHAGAAFEAQATPGDSGGAAFFLRDGAWELAGIMTSTQTLTGQPEGTVVFGSQTVLADLSRYRDQILELVNRDEALWQNPANHFDVSDSGRVGIRDLVLVINELVDGGVRDLEGAPGEMDAFVDVNGDYRLSIGDAQRLINGLLGGTVNPRSSTAGTNFVPEPSAAALAATGLLAALLGRFLLRRRKR